MSGFNNSYKELINTNLKQMFPSFWGIILDIEYLNDKQTQAKVQPLFLDNYNKLIEPIICKIFSIKSGDMSIYKTYKKQDTVLVVCPRNNYNLIPNSIEDINQTFSEAFILNSYGSYTENNMDKDEIKISFNKDESYIKINNEGVDINTKDDSKNILINGTSYKEHKHALSIETSGVPPTTLNIGGQIVTAASTTGPITFTVVATGSKTGGIVSK